jgi:hypothetical protein
VLYHRDCVGTVIVIHVPVEGMIIFSYIGGQSKTQKIFKKADEVLPILR